MADETRRLKNKLTRIISKAGLSWVTYGSIVDFADELPGDHKTACWVYDKISKKERVLFHKDFLANLPVPLLVLVLRHEFLHKAMYRNIKGATNLALVNIALDAAINKILFLSNPRGMIRLAKILFPENTPEAAQARLNITCVMNPSITKVERDKLDSRLKKIFDDIYLTKTTRQEKTASGNYAYYEEIVTNADIIGSPYCFNKEVPEPLTLYNKLAALLSNEQKKQIQSMYDWLKAGGRGGDEAKNTQMPAPASKSDNKSQDQTPITDEIEEPEEPEKPNKQNIDDTKDNEEDLEPSEPLTISEPDEEPEEEVPTVNEVGDSDDSIYRTNELGKRVYMRGGLDRSRASDRKTLEEEINPIKELCSEGYSVLNNLKAYFDKHVYAKKDADSRGLNDFIAHWQTEKQIETAINTIYNEIKSTSTLDTIPLDLTRTGFELVVLDVCGPDQIPLYFNENKMGAKKKICCYFDTSPSMHLFIPYMVSIAEFFDSCDECEISGGDYKGRYCFSEKVQGIDEWDKFIKGEVDGGGGTSFEIVVKHALERINEDEVDLIVVFTDGLSGVNKETIDEFNRTNKKCYTIYFTDPHKNNYNWHHPRSHEERETWEAMHSDLDLLVGENFTIFVDTSEKEE